MCEADAGEEKCTSVVMISVRTTLQTGAISRRIVHRIRSNVRRGDTVALLDTSCMVILPGTTFAGAQAVARRLTTLLIDVEPNIQIACGEAAIALLERLYNEQTVVINAEDEVHGEGDRVASGENSVFGPPALIEASDSLPYLAFITSYPPPRVFHLFSYELACRYYCVPVGAERGILTLATCQKLTQDVLSHIQDVTRRNIFQVRCEARVINDILNYWKRTLFV